MVKSLRVLCLVGMGLLPEVLFAGEGKVPDYQRDVAPIFRTYCTGCHNPDDADGKLVLSSYGRLKRGGENGVVIVPGKPQSSRMILLLEKKAKPFMPPEDNEAPTAKEIAILKAWIKAGAKGPTGNRPQPTALVVPKIKVIGRARRPINSLAASPNGKWIALGRYAAVEIVSAGTRQPVRTLGGVVGSVNAVGFSEDGNVLYAAGGQPGLAGQAVLWKTDGWKKIRTIKGHRDSIYSAALSPDGRIFATGSYDKLIKLWDTATGRLLRELKGHNGPVFGLAFRPGGRILASASGDRTVKLWEITTGKRLETFSQPTKAQYTVAFSPDGRFVVSGGVDNRVRVWRISERGREGTNPLVYSRFAHDAPIINLAFSPDGSRLITSGEDRAVKVWETGRYTQLRAMKSQPDWVQGLAFGTDSRMLLVGRLDGSLSTYRLRSRTGGHTNLLKPITHIPLPKPLAALPVKRTTITEAEPNDFPKQATPIPAPGIGKGILDLKPYGTADADLYRFRSRRGQTWVIETSAARDKSPADTKIEVLDDRGQPILRYLLRAVRDSYITFRPINSSQANARVKNWREMTLNEFMYMNGEVCKLFKMPEGPDSGFRFYTNRGKRRCYFDTSATVHANGDPVYIVQVYPPGTKLSDNGLPIFPLHYVNDDDGERELGADSRLTFTAPRDGKYLVRVTDVRGLGGRNFRYRLTIRSPRPDFNITLGGKNATIPAGSGQRLTVSLDRIDHFNGPVRVDISGVPRGFRVTSPIVVEAGHLEARGGINADADLPPTAGTKSQKSRSNNATAKKDGSIRRRAVPAPKPRSEPDWSSVRITATAMIQGRLVRKKIGNLGNIKVGPRPKLTVSLRPEHAASTATGTPELVVKPGTTVTAVLHIERNGENGPVRFDLDNLPHGVIVANLGLNGITLLPGQTERRLFIRADMWVPDSTRLIFAVSRGAGTQVSRPVRFHVRRSGEVAGR